MFKFFSRKEPYFLHLAILNLMYSIYMLFSEPSFFNTLPLSDLTIGQIRSLSICTVILFFYLFFIDFLALAKYHWVRCILVFGVCYMSVVICCKLFRYQWPELAGFYDHVWSRAFLYVDLLMFLSLLIYLIRAKEKYLNYILAGNCSIMFFAGLLFFREPLNISIPESLLRQAELIAGISFYFMAIVKREKEMHLEHQQTKEALLRQELKRQTDILNERNRISRDMHDELGAGISAIKLQLEFLKQRARSEDLHRDVNDLLKITDDMNRSMREMLWSLDAQNDRMQDFADYLRGYGAAFFAKTPIRFQFNQRNINAEMLIDASIRRELISCVKEALNNAGKHSGAGQVRVIVEQLDHELTITVEDDGKGIDDGTSINGGNNDGFGMKNMHARMAKINGSLSIESSPIVCRLRFRLSL